MELVNLNQVLIIIRCLNLLIYFTIHSSYSSSTICDGIFIDTYNSLLFSNDSSATLIPQYFFIFRITKVYQNAQSIIS